MPTQNTTIAEGLEDCEAVRISYSTAATPNAPILTDDESRYLLVERPEPTQALKIVLQRTDASDPYDSYTASYRVTGSSEQWIDDAKVPLPYDETFSNYSFNKGPYGRSATRTIDQNFPDGGYSNETRLTFFCLPVVVEDYDEAGNSIASTAEPVGFEIGVSTESLLFYGTGNGGDIFLAGSSSTQVLSLTTLDGRSIDIETAAVSDGWAIVVYEVYEWGDSELSRFQFDSDPQATARCNDQRCDNGCIEIVRQSDGAWNCICFDPPARPPALGPPHPAPDLPLPIHPKEAIHKQRAPLKQQRAKLAEAEAAYRETLDEIDDKEQEIDNAISQGDQIAEAAAREELNKLKDKGSEQAEDYQKLKNENTISITIDERLVNPEKESEITVVPTYEGSRYPPIPVFPVVEATTSQGISISSAVTTPTVRGGGILVN